MFRRLTLNSHGDVAPTIVALFRRASVPSDVGHSRAACCDIEQQQSNMSTGLLESKVGY